MKLFKHISIIFLISFLIISCVYLVYYNIDLILNHPNTRIYSAWELNDWSSFGQSFGLITTIFTTINIFIIIITLYFQFRQSNEQDNQQNQKIGLLKKQFMYSTKLKALDVFVKTQNYEDSNLDKKIAIEKSARKPHNNKIIGYENEKSKIKSYIKNSIEEIANTLNELPNEEFPKRLKSFNDKTMCLNSSIDAIRTKIGNFEGIPKHAVISSSQILNLPENEKQRIYYLKKYTDCKFWKWIDYAFKYEPELVLEDIDLYYNINAKHPYLSCPLGSPYFARLSSLNTSTPFKQNYFLHNFQLTYIAKRKPTSTEDLQSLNWTDNLSQYNLLSKIQLLKYGDIIPKEIIDTNNMYPRVIRNFILDFYNKHSIKPLFSDDSLNYIIQSKISKIDTLRSMLLYNPDEKLEEQILNELSDKINSYT